MSPTNLVNWVARSNSNTYLTILVITMFARLVTFFRPTIDHDETTYAVMADHMIKGAILYKDIIDIKQPGIFIIFSLIQLLFGKSVVIIRLVSALTIASSAFLLYKTKRKLQFDFGSSLLSAIVFVLMFNFYFGFSTNTEVFFIFCSCLGMYLFFTSTNFFQYLLSGLAFGLGFTIKQHIAFDFAALGIFFFMLSITKSRLKANLIPMISTFIGFLIPILAVHIAFSITGYYEYYHFISYVAPFNYSNGNRWITSCIFLLKAILVYLPFVLAALAGMRSNTWNKETGWFITLLSAMCILAICSTGKSHQHYYLQLAYPVSFAAGEFASLTWVQRLTTLAYVRKTFTVFGIVYLVFLANHYYHRYIIRPDKASDLAVFLEDKISQKTSLYTGDAPQYLYWYFDKISPTPYVHSTLLTKPSNIFTLDIDLKSELDKIYNSQPEIVILSESYPYDWFQERVQSQYKIIGRIHQYNIYHR